MTAHAYVEGGFYVDNVTDDFYLGEFGAWAKKGRFYRSLAIGLVSEGPFPFIDAQVFELAPGRTPMHFYNAFSASRSTVACDYPAAASCEIVLTDDLAGFLSTGTNVICRAAIDPTSHNAALSFTDTILGPYVQTWVVMPLTADVAMAGLRALFVGEPI